VQFTLTELQVLAGLANGLTVVDIGNQLSLGHSAISRALHVAQQRAGIQLVERDGRRLRLTLAGRDLAARATSAVREIDDVNRLAEAQRAGTSGIVRVLSTTTPADYLLPGVIAEFLQQAPQVSVLVRTSIAERETFEGYDLRIGPPEPVPAGWRNDLLFTDELVFFVSARSPLVHLPDVTWSDIEARTLIGTYLDPYWPRYWMPGVPGLPLPRHVVDVSTHEAVKNMVDAMDAVGLGVRTAVRDGLASGQFVELPGFGGRVDLPYFLAYRDGVLLPVVERFRQLLVRQAAGRRDC
jgi:DNA-binding transcriptional LysR family regulator